MEVDEVDDNCPCKKIHRISSMMDAIVKAIGITIRVGISSEHHSPNPSHHGSQDEGPNHAATETTPYAIPNHSVKYVASFDIIVLPPVSLSSSTKQHPQQKIVDSDGSEAQIQRNPRKAFKTVSTIERTMSNVIDVDRDLSFSLL